MAIEVLLQCCIINNHCPVDCWGMGHQCYICHFAEDAGKAATQKGNEPSL